jgi:hypothetical protein
MSQRNGSNAQSNIERMLSAIFTMCLLNEGIDPLQLDELVRRSRAKANQRAHRLKPNRAKAIDLVLLGSVLHRWNRTPNYLDVDARPFPIKAAGPAPSIQALFRAERSRGAFEEGVKQMTRLGLIRRNRVGLYRPRNDLILLHSLTPEMVANLALSINRLIETLLQNTATKRRTASRLIERNALVSDLPKRYLEEFKAFSREQGAALVSTMNDWLESRRRETTKSARKSRIPTVSAGIHVFAFSEPTAEKKLLR